MNMRILLAAAAAIATVAVAGPAKANLISNGNFGTGDFTGWTLSGDLNGGSSVGSSGNPTQPSGPGFGNSAYLGTLGGILDLGQTFSTVAGQTYDLTFFLQADGGPGTFTTDINNVQVGSVSVNGATDWTLYDLSFTATGASTQLDFLISNDPSFFELTDVNVPEPSTLALMLVGVAGLVGYGMRRRAATPSSFA
jgi:hypothetical protein